jgi:predicted anti-sigma-YlaC factor YlaD
MNHDEIFALMMDMLDGEASEEGIHMLETHLRACPECEQEWRALVAIDTLFRQTPALSPAADFVEKTLARLPNRQARIWAMGAIYGAILLGGLIPLVLIGYLGFRLLPVLSQPALLGSIYESLNITYRAATVILAALLSGAGEVLIQQPIYMGVLLVVAGIIFVWGGVYKRLVTVEI